MLVAFHGKIELCKVCQRSSEHAAYKDSEISMNHVDRLSSLLAVTFETENALKLQQEFWLQPELSVAFSLSPHTCYMNVNLLAMAGCIPGQYIISFN